MEIEFEKTYLLKEIPKNIEDYENEKITDIYIPASIKHPILRIRKRGENYEMIKKSPIKKTDSSEQEEQIIILSEEEFNEFKKISGKKLSKKRYYLPINNKIAEVDLFLGKLKGLGLVDFEFDNSEEKQNFEAPSFCLADITQKEFIAGGMLAGKGYPDIEKQLKKYDYQKLNY